MLIGIDASRANRLEKTGVEWYAYHLIRDIFKIDSKNQYFLYTDSPLADNLKRSKINYKERYLKWPLSKFWTMGRMSLEMLINKPDVLFIPSHTFPLVSGKKNVITWHDIGYEKYPETYTKWQLTSLKQGAKKAMKVANKIITISNFTKKEMIDIYNINPDRIKVIYLGCNHERWYPVPQNTIKDFLKRNNISLPYFVYLGKLSLRKNIIGLIRIYNRFREKYKSPHNLILTGSESTFQNEIDDEIQASPYRNEIKKLGWIPTEKLPILLSGAQSLVFPSIYEGFGLPTIEAMACGCPVIASNAGSLPEIIQDAGIMCDTHDVEAFADNMIKIIKDEGLRRHFIAKGLTRARDFTWDKCARETLEVLESV